MAECRDTITGVPLLFPLDSTRRGTSQQTTMYAVAAPPQDAPQKRHEADSGELCSAAGMSLSRTVRPQQSSIGAHPLLPARPFAYERDRGFLERIGRAFCTGERGTASQQFARAGNFKGQQVSVSVGCARPEPQVSPWPAQRLFGVEITPCNAQVVWVRCQNKPVGCDARRCRGRRPQRVGPLQDVELCFPSF